MKTKKAVVLGLGQSGRSAVEFLWKKGYSLLAVDHYFDKIKSSTEIVDLCARGLIVKEQLLEEDLGAVEFIVLSPGIPLTNEAVVLAKKNHIEVIGEIELACRDIKNRFCIGITGTNGKTTVTLLIEHILKECHIRAKAMGNVGLPLTSQVLLSDADILIIELSSYQLESLSTPILDLALILNITPDHLDRYPSLESYAEAKFRIVDVLKPTGTCYVNEKKIIKLKGRPSIQSFGFSSDSTLYADDFNIYLGEKKIASLPTQYHSKKTHDVENFLAAFAICNHFIDHSEKILKSFELFIKPKHRIEFVTKIKEIAFYNDSKGTNVDAVLCAVKSLEGQIVLIAGGVDKGGDYFSWRNVFPGKVKGVYVIGEASKKIEVQLKNYVHVKIVSNLEEAVALAYRDACPGDNVLLSPGCSSYDMFLNYEHRGNEFKRIVKALEDEDKINEPSRYNYSCSTP